MPLQIQESNTFASRLAYRGDVFGVRGFDHTSTGANQYVASMPYTIAMDVVRTLVSVICSSPNPRTVFSQIYVKCAQCEISRPRIIKVIATKSA